MSTLNINLTKYLEECRHWIHNTVNTTNISDNNNHNNENNENKKILQINEKNKNDSVIRYPGQLIRPNEIFIHWRSFCHDDTNQNTDFYNIRTRIVFVTGWNESFIKYAELIKQLFEEGYDIYTYDHRSQGFSSRIIENSQCTYVEKFDDYVDDLIEFIQTVVMRDHEEYMSLKATQQRRYSSADRPYKIYVIAHSMGGLISLLAHLKKPKLFDGLVLSAPMLEMNPGFPSWLGHLVTKIACKIGLGSKYASGHDVKAETPISERLTHSLERLAEWENIRRISPRIVCGGHSFRWSREAFDAQLRFEKEMHKVSIPILLFQADRDDFVHADRQNKFIKILKNNNNNKNISKKLFFKNSYHEILMESDNWRDIAINETLDFLKNGKPNLETNKDMCHDPPLISTLRSRKFLHTMTWTFIIGSITSMTAIVLLVALSKNSNRTKYKKFSNLKKK